MSDEFLKCLRKGERESDKEALMKYLDGQITLGMCRQRIFMHNDVPEEVQEMNSVEEFEKWIESLGWKCIRYKS